MMKLKPHIKYDKVAAMYTSNYRDWFNMMNLMIDKINEYAKERNKKGLVQV